MSMLASLVRAYERLPDRAPHGYSDELLTALGGPAPGCDCWPFHCWRS